LATDLKSKRVVALCGQSGCGKSSIISLIERFYEPSEGTILFNGREISQLDPEWYHRQVGIVSQEPVLFSGTIADNIIYGLDIEDKTDAEVHTMLDEACKMASCYDFIYDATLFPDGYDTVVGERGVKLSGG
jgi:ABC-type multidrug transport system fused ATPase/permease subunit